jgi:hypothetical protein
LPAALFEMSLKAVLKSVAKRERVG